jgi:hypothetical protein
MFLILGSPVNSVSIRLGYGLEDRGIGVLFPTVRFFFSSLNSHRLWDPFKLLFSGRQRQVPRGMVLIPQLPLIPTLSVRGAVNLCPIHLHCVMFKYARTQFYLRPVFITSNTAVYAWCPKWCIPLKYVYT